MKRIAVCLFLLTISSAAHVTAQGYPNKLIRVVTLEAGGSSDFVSRLVAQGLTSSLGQQTIVENRAGAALAGEAVAKAAPDGYTLLGTGSLLWLGPLLQKAPYDVVRDFAPITSTHRSPNILVVHPSLPVRSVRDLIALAKSRPGALNYSSGAIGGAPHLAGELFKALASVNIVVIPYKGTAQAVNDLIGGHVQLMFSSAVVTPHIKSGRLRALAVTTAQPSVLFPALPTIAAAGVPGYEFGNMAGIFAPAKTPEPIVVRLNQEIVRYLNRPEIQERLLNTGVEPAPSTPEQFAATIKSEIARMGKVIKDAGIHAE